MSDGSGLFFGCGTGRCGTMTLANLLNAEAGVACLHEGRFRLREEQGEQWLPFLTLQNLQAYLAPQAAPEILQRARAGMPALRQARGLRLLGDIAYNYSPFVAALRETFPAARLVFIHRDGREFVRSAYTDETPDPTPVGWLDEGRSPTRLERFVALGRLRPREIDPEAAAWPSLPPIERNAWLWAETNRIILGAIESWPAEQVFWLRFESFVAQPLEMYRRLRKFLGIEAGEPEALRSLLDQPINRRARKILPPVLEWSEDLNQRFAAYADAMMRRLGYE